MEDDCAVTPALRWVWATGTVLLVAGLLLSVGGRFNGLYPGLLVLAVVSGVTAARGRPAGTGWLVAAWSVPLLPLVLAAGAAAYLAYRDLDSMGLVILLFVTVGIWLGVMAAFGVSLVCERTRLHLRRRRFGGARPAWENVPIPPPYS